MRVQKIAQVGFDVSKEPRSHVRVLDSVREAYAADIERLKDFWNSPYPVEN